MNRAELVKRLKKLEPFEGRFVRKLSAGDLETVKQAVDGLMPQNVQAYSTTGAPYICLDGLREDIHREEEKQHTRDRIESCPALDEYKAAIKTVLDVSARLREEYGDNVFNEMVASRTFPYLISKAF